MENSVYLFWRYAVFQVLYIIMIAVVMQLLVYDNAFFEFFARFGAILLVSLCFFILEAWLKKQAKKTVFRSSKEAGSRLLSELLKALILAGAVVAFLTFTITGDGSFVMFQNRHMIINLDYLLVYALTYLISTILINWLTKI